MRKMRKIVVILLVLFGAVKTEKCFSQASLIVYSNNVIGVKSSQDRLFGGELKFFSNVPTGRVEIDGFLNFKKKTFHQFSVGFGLNLNTNVDRVFNAVTMPLSWTLSPFQECKSTFVKRFSIVLEVCPEYYPDYNYYGERLFLRNLYGLRYKFKD